MIFDKNELKKALYIESQQYQTVYDETDWHYCVFERVIYHTGLCIETYMWTYYD